MFEVKNKTSGNKRWTLVTGSRLDLERAARVVRAEVKQDGRGCHLDLTPRQADRFLEKFAAKIIITGVVVWLSWLIARPWLIIYVIPKLPEWW